MSANPILLNQHNPEHEPLSARDAALLAIIGHGIPRSSEVKFAMKSDGFGRYAHCRATHIGLDGRKFDAAVMHDLAFTRMLPSERSRMEITLMQAALAAVRQVVRDFNRDTLPVINH